MNQTPGKPIDLVDDPERRILDLSVRLAVFGMLPAYALGMLVRAMAGQDPSYGRWHFVLVVGGGLLVPLLSRARASVRAAQLILLAVSVSAAGLLRFGPLLGVGPMFMASLPLAALFFGWRGLVGTSALTGLAYVLIGAVFVTGAVDAPPPETGDLSILASAARIAIATTIALVALGLLVVYLMRSFDEASENRDAAFDRERRERDARARTQRSLQRSQRLETVGRLASGVAHDFNNALVVVVGTTQLLERSSKIDAAGRRLAGLAQEAAWQAAEVSRELLSFSRREERRLESVDVDDALEHMAKVLSRLLPEDVTVSADVDSDVEILIDRSEFGQILLNLGIQADDAMPHGGPLEFRARVAEREATTLAPDGEVLVEVLHGGESAISEPPLARSELDPDSSTPRSSDAFGQPLVRDYVERAGGTFHREIRESSGTRIVMHFPVHASGASGAAGEAIAPTTLRARVLLFEPARDVRALLTRYLRDAGFVVTAVDDVDDAAQRLEAGERFDLLVLELSASREQAESLARLFVERIESARVLFCSVAGEEGPSASELGAARVASLAKPYSLTDFSQCVDQLLSSDDGRRDHG